MDEGLPRHITGFHHPIPEGIPRLLQGTQAIKQALGLLDQLQGVVVMALYGLRAVLSWQPSARRTTPRHRLASC